MLLRLSVRHEIHAPVKNQPAVTKLNRRSLSVTKLKREGRAPVTKLIDREPVTKLKAGSPVTKLTGGPVTKLQRKVLNLVAYKLLFRVVHVVLVGRKKSSISSIRALAIIPAPNWNPNQNWKLKVSCVMRPCR